MAGGLDLARFESRGDLTPGMFTHTNIHAHETSLKSLLRGFWPCASRYPTNLPRTRTTHAERTRISNNSSSASLSPTRVKMLHGTSRNAILSSMGTVHAHALYTHTQVEHGVQNTRTSLSAMRVKMLRGSSRNAMFSHELSTHTHGFSCPHGR